MTDLSDSIETNAQNPRKATVDGNSAEQQPLRDQIEADRYLASKAAAGSAKRGLAIAKLSPPGTI